MIYIYKLGIFSLKNSLDFVNRVLCGYYEKVLRNDMDLGLKNESRKGH